MTDVGTTTRLPVHEQTPDATPEPALGIAEQPGGVDAEHPRIAPEYPDGPNPAVAEADNVPAARRGRRMRRLAVRFASVLAAVCALPLVLAVVYRFVPPASTLMIERWVVGRPVHRTWMPLADISPRLARAVMTSEDARFCLHDGIDVRQMRFALDALAAGGSPRGASTIPMQVTKNLFLWPDRSYVRKAVEVPLALWLDFVLPKPRILEIYLNTVQWGPGIFGAAAAVDHYYKKPMSAVTQDEANLLAAALPSPGTRNPIRPNRAQRRQADHIAFELARSDWIFSCLPASIQPRETPEL